jgi:hypothetical protein
VDPHHVVADLDSTYHPDADQDFYLMRMRVRIRLFTLMCIGTDPNSDPSFQVKAQTLEKMPKNRLKFHKLWPVICKLMWIWVRFRIQVITVLIRMR